MDQLAKSSFQDWEDLVKKQLKTDDILNVLQKKNIENIKVFPYYNQRSVEMNNLPKVEENTHLISLYNSYLEEDVFAFLLEENVEHLQEKSIFIKNEDLAKAVSMSGSNSYYSLVDVIDYDSFSIKKDLISNLVEKNFKRSIAIDSVFFQNSGASIIQQLGILLAQTKELTEIYGSEILDKLVFKMAAGSSYFFEIAKIRSFKILFNKFSQEFDLDLFPYVYVENTLRNKSIHDTENNLIRSTLELASAMIGGADAIFSNDFTLGEKTDLSSEISFKQQIVLAYESIINVFEDAGNGSYYIDSLTKDFATKAWEYFVEIENNGGFLEVLNKGILQKEIYRQATTEQKWVEEGKTKLVGVNIYPQREKTKTINDLYDENTIRKVRLAEMFE